VQTGECNVPTKDKNSCTQCQTIKPHQGKEEEKLQEIQMENESTQRHDVN